MSKRERIKITQPCRGSEDGFTVLNFTPDGGAAKDGVYEVATSLAAAFCDEQKTAERVGLAGVADKVAEAVSGAVEAVVAAAKPTKGKAAKGKAAAADDEPAPDAPAEG